LTRADPLSTQPLPAQGRRCRHRPTRVSVDFYIIEAKPENLAGDKAYDSDALHEALKKKGVEMIPPQRSNRTLETQDGRRLRRYARHWMVERFFARAIAVSPASVRTVSRRQDLWTSRAPLTALSPKVAREGIRCRRWTRPSWRKKRTVVEKQPRRVSTASVL